MPMGFSPFGTQTRASRTQRLPGRTPRSCNSPTPAMAAFWFQTHSIGLSDFGMPGNICYFAECQGGAACLACNCPIPERSAVLHRNSTPAFLTSVCIQLGECCIVRKRAKEQDYSALSILIATHHC